LGNGKWKSQAHIAALYPRNSNQVTVISIDHLPRFTPLFMALWSFYWHGTAGLAAALSSVMQQQDDDR
jgi:hypothetical protein